MQSLLSVSERQREGLHRLHWVMLKWRNVPEGDYFLYARSFRAAAKKLAGALDDTPRPLPEFDACPVLFMYRHAVLLHLKVLVLADGGNFLATRPDELSVHKSRSLSWLAQFVSQIVVALKWEGEFKCAGVESLADFKALIEETNGIDPPFHAFRSPFAEGSQDIGLALRDFLRRLDSLLELLDRTADGIAAECQLRYPPVGDEENERGRTIH